MKRLRNGLGVGIILAALSAPMLVALPASGYEPTGDVIFSLPDDPCLKGRGNCIVYPKSAQLPSGRLVMTFERSLVQESGGATGQTLPIFASDDYGDSWEQISEVAPPSDLSDDPAMDKYLSNWTNPYLYVLPEDVGELKAGTLLLASVVSGEDAYYLEQKANEPAWIPNNDGDRANVAIALFQSTDEGGSWDFVNIVTEGGWQGGSAGAIGTRIAGANTYGQIDPVWEPYLFAHNGKLITYFSDENDYLGFDPATGVLVEDPDNDTASDAGIQILAHRSWDGVGAWSAPIVDAWGNQVSRGNGKVQIGGGRPGMTNVVETTDGKFMMTFEFFANGNGNRYKLSTDPNNFFGDADPDGVNVNTLTRVTGSRSLNNSGSPVLVSLPDGRLAYNSSGSGSVWTNNGSSTGPWTEYQTTLAGGYSRNLTPIAGTGRVLILQSIWGGANTLPVIRHADIDFGGSDGLTYQLVNRKSGQVLGTGGKTNDANLGNANTPDIVQENPNGSVTQQWQVVPKTSGSITLLNQSGGRSATVWTGNATAGQRIAQWVDESTTGAWRFIPTTDGYVKLRSVVNSNMFLTGVSNGSPATVQLAASDGSQEWLLVPVAPAASELTARNQKTELISSDPSVSALTIQVDASAATPSGAARHAGATAHAFLYVGSEPAVDLGAVALDAQQRATVTLPDSLPESTTFRVAVAYEDAPLQWDEATILAADSDAPAISVVVDPSNPTGDNGWYTGEVSVSVSATDELDASPLVEVSVDGGAWSEATAPVELSTDGTHSVKVRATDFVGNVSGVTDQVVRIDGVTPVSAATVDEQARTVTIRSADDTSGVGRTEVNVANGGWVTYEGPVTVGADQTVVQFRSVDRAGNVETAASAVVPKAGVTLTKSLTAANIADSSVRFYDTNSITVRVTGGSATATGTIKVVAGAVQVGSGTLSNGRVTINLNKALLVPGKYTLEVRYSGNAALEASTDTAELSVAKAAATVKASFVDSTIKSSTTPKVKVSVSSKAPVTGTVTVKEGSKTLKAKVTLMNGKATISLPKLKTGTHKVTVTYNGSSSIGTAKSSTITVKVS
ncbi:hypothetical protein Microterr_29550 [Microbacterium terricola]|uniref:Ig-like domain (Group 3) n=2 Tax=Microbacterium terricola TaxID=344163 RepID=A0ABM8E3B8_9MICO|nr:hypothetical protein Microterr_29550 [Microbacterium terricola]